MSNEAYKKLVNQANSRLEKKQANDCIINENTKSALMFIKTHKHYLQYIAHSKDMNERYKFIIEYFTINIGVINSKSLVYPLFKIGIFTNKFLSLLGSILLIICILLLMKLISLLLDENNIFILFFMVLPITPFVFIFILKLFTSRFHMYNSKQW